MDNLPPKRVPPTDVRATDGRATDVREDWFEISTVTIASFTALMSEGRPIDGEKIQVRFFLIVGEAEERREITREVADTLLRMRLVGQQNQISRG